LAVALSAAAAFAADEALPKAETVLDRYVEVTGGKAAYEKRHNETVTGSVELAGQGLKGTISIYSTDANKSYVAIDLEGVGKIESGDDGTTSWELSAMQGPRIKDGLEKAESRREFYFNAPLRWREIYSSAETTGAETVEGEDCFKVVLTPKEGKPETTYYSKKTGFLVKVTATQTSQMGEVPTETLPSDYKDAGGILAPYTIDQKMAGQEIVIKIQDVKTNSDIPKDRFDLPKEIKALADKASK
jgi:hypothetical protein